MSRQVSDIINAEPRQHRQVRENLINEANPVRLNLQLQPLPVIRQPTSTHSHFVHLAQFQQMIALAQTRRTSIPLIPISGYKFYSEICLFFACLVQVIFFSWNIIHLLWFIWYITLGYHRHQPSNRRVRFVGEFVHLSIWIFTNCYIFSSSQHKSTVFPVVFLLINMDFYFIGVTLFLTYFCFISYAVWNCFADCRLKRIEMQLKKRRKYLVENTLRKFVENQNHKHNQIQPSSTQQSVQEMENATKQENMCPICLSSISQQSGLRVKSTKIVKLPCTHRYHYQCIKAWVDTDQWKCPVCRSEMLQ